MKILWHHNKFHSCNFGASEIFEMTVVMVAGDKRGAFLWIMSLFTQEQLSNTHEQTLKQGADDEMKGHIKNLTIQRTDCVSSKKYVLMLPLKQYFIVYVLEKQKFVTMYECRFHFTLTWMWFISEVPRHL